MPNRFFVSIPTTTSATAPEVRYSYSTSSIPAPQGMPSLTTPSPDFPNPNDARPRKRMHLNENDSRARQSRGKGEGTNNNASSAGRSSRESKMLPVTNELDSVEEELKYLTPSGLASSPRNSKPLDSYPKSHSEHYELERSLSRDSEMDTSDIVPSAPNSSLLLSSVDMDATDDDSRPPDADETSSTSSTRSVEASWEKRRRWKRSCSELFETSGSSMWATPSHAVPPSSSSFAPNLGKAAPDGHQTRHTPARLRKRSVTASELRPVDSPRSSEASAAQGFVPFEPSALDRSSIFSVDDLITSVPKSRSTGSLTLNVPSDGQGSPRLIFPASPGSKSTLFSRRPKTNLFKPTPSVPNSYSDPEVSSIESSPCSSPRSLSASPNPSTTSNLTTSLWNHRASQPHTAHPYVHHHAQAEPSE